MNYLCYEDRQKLKNKKFASTNKIWNNYNFNSRKSVGCTNKLIKEFHSDKTVDNYNKLTIENWQIFYFNNGKTLEEIKNVAFDFQLACFENDIILTTDEAISYILIRVIDEVFQGFEREQNALKEISKKYTNCTIKYSNYNEDCDYAIDIIVYENAKIIAAFQVKPKSFLYGVSSKKDYCLKALKENNEKHQKFKEKHNTQPFFWIDNKIYSIKNDLLVPIDITKEPH